MGQIDEASADVLAQESKLEAQEKEARSQKKKKAKMRGKLKGAKESKGKDRVHDSKTRELLRKSNISKLKVRKAEEEKLGKDFENLKELEKIEFNPLKLLNKGKKIKKA